MPDSPFSRLPAATPDAIFAITAQAIAAGPEAINGTIGVFMDEEGKPAVFESVQRALKDLGNNILKLNYSYPSLPGIPEYRSSISSLIFGPDQRAMAFASTAGTGAVGLGLRCIKLIQPKGTVILPTPAWANHRNLIRWSFLNIAEVPYANASGLVDADAVIDAIYKQTQPFSIILQVGCHNPTGLDFSPSQWKDIADALRKKPDAIALLDFAYQGFAGSPDADASPVRLFTDLGIATIVAWSASKNHSIYGLRTGLVAIPVQDESMRSTLEGHFSTLSRGMHSVSSTFGQYVVATVQQNYQKQWLKDLDDARNTMNAKRQALIGALPMMKNALSGNGMFAILPLSIDQVTRLKKDHKVFVTNDGRINIAGIPMKRVGELCEKIGRVL